MTTEKKPTAKMNEYALEEMIRLLKNMERRPIECYSQTIKGEGKKFFLGRNFIEQLIEGLKNQYLKQ